MNQAIVQQLNTYLADATAMYVKLHNLHWNVVGLQFKAVHEYLETLYDGFAGVIDTVAELLKMHAERPLASMKDFLATTQIQEIESKDYTVCEVLKIVTEDIAHIQKSVEALRRDADAEDLYDVVMLLEEHLGNYNKTLWFLASMVQ